MSILTVLSEKPWLPRAEDNDEFEINESQQKFDRKRTALRFFLAVASVVFSLFIITFLERSQIPDFQALAGQPWQPLSDSWRLWVNTSFLLASGIALQSAIVAAKKQNLYATLVSISIAVIFSIQFILAQLWVWKGLAELGYFVASNPANSYFYLFTAVHGLHLLGGIPVLAAVIFRVARLHLPHSSTTWPDVCSSLRLCSTYWHYLFGVWLVLFALLTSSAETYQLLAALCGF